MVDWDLVLAGLGVIGGSLVVFLFFIGITVFISRRRHQRLAEREGRRSLDSSIPTISSEEAGIGGPLASSSLDLRHSPISHKEHAAIESEHCRPGPPSRRRCPPIKKINLVDTGVSLSGVTQDETTTDSGLLSRAGGVLFDEQRRQQALERLQRRLNEEQVAERDARQREQRTLQSCQEDQGSSDSEDGLDQRFLTYLQRTLLEQDSGEDISDI